MFTFEERLNRKMAKRKAHADLKAQAKRLRITIPELRVILACPDPARRARMLAMKTPKPKKKHEYINGKPFYYHARWTNEDVKFILDILVERRANTPVLSVQTKLTKYISRLRKGLKKLKPLSA